jgi:hypothetical protein
MPSEFKIPSCIEKIYVSSNKLIPKNGIKAEKVIIDCLDRSYIRKPSNPDTQSYEEIANLKHIQCRKMWICDIISHPTIVLAEGLEELKIGFSQSYLALPNSLRILHCYSDVTIKRMSQNLEELSCRGAVDIIDSPELPKSLSIFRAERLGNRAQSALLSCYKSLKLKSLIISLDVGLDFRYLESLEKLYLKIYEEFEKIPCFPPKLKKLYILCNEYSTPLPEIPKTLKEFRFSLSKTYKLPLPKLPSGLEVLKLEGVFIERIDFPESIRELTFFEYPHEIDFSKLCNLKILKIGNYDYDLTDLCDGLEELIFDCFSEYDRDIILPRTVRRVHLSNLFNREIVLPESLEEIIFGDRFNQKVVMPSRIVKVTFGNRFNQEIDLPDSLQEVSFDRSFNRPIKKLPSNLKRLRIGKRYKGLLPPLPKTLKELEFL